MEHDQISHNTNFFLNFKILPFLPFHHAQKGTTFQFNELGLKIHAFEKY